LAGDWQAALKKVFKHVKSSQQVFWNPGTTQLLGGLEDIAIFLKKVTVLAINQDEATELVLRTDAYRKKKRSFLDNPRNLLQIIKAAGPQIVVITRGPEGVIAFDGQKFYEREVVHEKKKVDSTGVGDIFNSTFAAGLNLYSGEIDKALDLALRNAASKVAHLGAQNGLITLK